MLTVVGFWLAVLRAMNFVQSSEKTDMRKLRSSQCMLWRILSPRMWPFW